MIILNKMKEEDIEEEVSLGEEETLEEEDMRTNHFKERIITTNKKCNSNRESKEKFTEWIATKTEHNKDSSKMNLENSEAEEEVALEEIKG